MKRPRIRAQVAAVVLIAAMLTGCAGEPGDANAQRSARHPAAIGEQRYTCSDGSQWDVDFVEDGLKLDLTSQPDGKVARLTAAAQGMTFVGNRVAAVLSGRQLFIDRDGDTRLTCARSQEGAIPMFLRSGDGQ